MVRRIAEPWSCGAILIMSVGAVERRQAERAAQVSRGTPLGDGRRLPRHQGRRPLPAARGPGRAGDPRLGRGRERGDLRLPRVDPAARRDPQAADRALGLREIQPARRRKAAGTSSRTTRACRTRASCTRLNRSTARPRVLLDPNTLSADGTVALWRGPRSARTAGYLAYGIAAAGSDWNEWKVRDVATGQGPPRPTSSGSSSREPSGRPTARASSTAASPSPGRATTSRGRTTTRRSITTASARPQADDRLVWEDPEHKEWRAVPDGHRRRQVPDPDDREGDRRQVSHPLPPARPARRQAGPPGRRVRRRLHLHRQRRAGLLVQDQQGRPARQGRRDRHAQARARATGSS